MKPTKFRLIPKKVITLTKEPLLDSEGATLLDHKNKPLEGYVAREYREWLWWAWRI